MENRKIARIIVAVVLLAGAMGVEHAFSLSVGHLLCIYLIPFLWIGYDVVWEALEGLARGKVFNEDFLMCVATVGALCIGFLPGAETEFSEAVFVMLFFQIGELFEDYAEGKSRKSISRLMDIRPDMARVLRDGKPVEVAPDAVRVGETIVVYPGEKIPLDGVVEKGISSLNTTALTGESVPRDVCEGNEVVSGCVNLSGILNITVRKTYGESTVSKIIELVENASENKSRKETFIARFARIYTPVVVFVAVVVAFIPPFFSAHYIEGLSLWLGRALTFLIVSCPCALVISVPLAFFCGIGGASKRGILIKGASYMEVLSKLHTVVFDKTGTLTRGRFEVTAVHPQNMDENELLHLAAHVERFSSHPIAVSLRNAFKKEDDGCSVEDVHEVAGQGIRARVNGRVVCVGNSRMMDATGVDWHPCHKEGTVVHVAVEGVYAGHIVIADTIKDEAEAAVSSLRRLGVEKIVVLTGDKKEVGESVSRKIGADECYAGLLPTGKVSVMERLLAREKRGETLAFVGDGINDAPVLARADVGIAMGGLGSDAAIEAADVVLMDDNLSKIAEAVSVSRRTIRIASQNTGFAISVKLLVLLLAGIGMATMWMAVFADVGVTVLAVLNATRCFGFRNSAVWHS